MRIEGPPAPSLLGLTPMTFHVALTGNVAAGKSAVADLLRDWGATVIDADAIVRALQQPGTAVFDAIVARFGPAIVAKDGTLDRAALRARVLDDPAQRRSLEAIVHPAVEAERRRLLAEARGPADAIVVSDIPLLFEVMDPEGFDAVVLVDAPESLRLERLRRLRARADFVIDNDSTREALRDRTWLAWRQLRSRARVGAR